MAYVKDELLHCLRMCERPSPAGQDHIQMLQYLVLAEYTSQDIMNIMQPET